MPVIGRFRLRRESRRAFLQSGLRFIQFSENHWQQILITRAFNRGVWSFRKHRTGPQRNVIAICDYTLQ